MKCRHCATPLELTLIDLGSAPPSNAYLTLAALQEPEKWYPLRVLVCRSCWLVQTEDFARFDELFSADYAYFSGYSASWLAHCERYVDLVIRRFHLKSTDRIYEVASNDGSLLKFFADRGFAPTGIEPTASTAEVSRAKGIETIEEFFGKTLARRLAIDGLQADLIVANNVLAHVPDINDFLAGFSILLKPEGVATFEFPHLVRLLTENQFDTIYHEHFSYLSLTAAVTIAEANGLSVFDVEQLTTHGGSLRIYVERADTAARAKSERLQQLCGSEHSMGVTSEWRYSGLQRKAENAKDDLLEFLLQAKRAGKKVVAYGAAAKGNTLLNFSGVRRDLIAFVADRNPVKQGKFLPGSRIPIVDEKYLRDFAPDYILILPWNLREEVVRQLNYASQWGAQFVTAIPSLRVFDSVAD